MSKRTRSYQGGAKRYVKRPPATRVYNVPLANDMYWNTVHATPRVGYASVPRTRGAAVTGEMKYFDTLVDNLAIPQSAGAWSAANRLNPGGTDTLVCPPQGAGISERIGKQIKLHKLKMRGYVIIPPQAAQAAADSPCFVRLMVVQDKQTNAAAFNPSLLMSASSVTATSFQNFNEFGRFKVWKDKMLTFGNVNLAGSPTASDVVQAGDIRWFKFNLNFKEPLEIKFNSSGATSVASLVNNSFHMVGMCSSAAYVPAIYYNCRACYKE